MSDHAHGQPGQGGDQDAVDYGKVIGVGVASLAIFAVSIWWASTIWRSVQADVEAKSGKSIPVDVSKIPAEIGIVDQVPFVSDRRLPTWRAERKAHLEGYGWTNRGAGLAHMPIDLAMQKIVTGGSPPGAPQ